MSDWTAMRPVQFDKTLVKGSKARAFVETAGETMFPDLLPEASRKPARVAEQLPGQADLFGEDE